MAKSSLILWIDVDTNRILDGWNSNNEAPAPTFVSGDTTDVEIHLVRQNASLQFEELPVAGKSFKLAIGLVDKVPNGGFWTLAYGNSQIDFEYNEKAEDVQNALNLIPEIIADGGVTVSLVNADTTYRVVFNNKVAISSTFSTDASNLLPSSIVQKSEVKIGSASTKSVWHFKPKQVPVAYQPNWTGSVNTSIATLTSLAGGVTRLSIGPDAPRNGTFTLGGVLNLYGKYPPLTGQLISSTPFSTFPISVNATEADFDVNFPPIAGGFSANTNGVTVKKVGAYSWDFTISSQTGQNGQYYFEAIYVVTGITNGAIIPYEYVTSTLSLNNYETASLLAGVGSADAVLEVEMTEAGAITTVLQTSCKIVSDIIGQSTYAPTPFDDPITQSDLDSALANKYDASNPNGYIQEASNLPFTFGRTGGQWEAVLPLTGGTMFDSAEVIVPTSTHTATLASIGLELGIVADDTKGSFVQAENISVFSETAIAQITADGFAITDIGSTSTLSISSTGITFPDATVMTTAVPAVDLSGYATLTGATFSGTVYTPTLRNLLNTDLVIDSYNDYGAGTHYLHKFTVADGKFVLAPNGGGLTFPDGTTQTTATPPTDLTGYATETFVTSQGYITGNLADYVLLTDLRIQALDTSFIPLSATAAVTYSLTYYDGYLGGDQTTDITITSPNGFYHGWTVILDDSRPAGYISTGVNTVTLGCNATTMQDALNYLASGVGGWTVSGSGSPYATSSVLAGSQTVSTPSVSLATNSGMKFLLREELSSELSRLARLAVAGDAVLSFNYTTKGVDWDAGYAKASLLSSYAPLAGATFTGKVFTTASGTASAGFNIGAGVAPTTPVAGDLWLLSASNYLYYRSPASATTFSIPVHQFTNTFSAPQIIDTTSNTLAGLRITQKGTFPALVVEDATNPDTTSFVVNASGAVGIQKDPATWVPTTGVVLDVGGKAVLTPASIELPSLNLGATASASSPTGAVNGDIWITNVASPKLAYRTGGVNYYPAVANQFNTFTGGLAVTGNSASNPQLSITQSGTSPALQVTSLGTGNALVVEDSTSPDADAFIINADGRVGIGVATGWTATEKLEVKGNIKFNDGTVQSTAFTTAQLPTASTVTQARNATNTTNFLTPNLAHWLLMNPNIIEIQRAGFTVTNTGTITYSTGGWIASWTRMGQAGACSSRWRTFGTSQVDQVMSMTDKSTPASNLDFSNASWCSGRSVLQGIADSVFSWGFYHGKAEGDGVGVLARRGYGWRATGGAGTRFLTLEVHNGTTLTSVTSTYAVTDSVAFDWDLISSGTGTVTLYVSGTQVATSTAGPTGSTNITPVVWQEEVATSGVASSPYSGMAHSRGKFIAFDP